jgi:hypothetical protein
MHHSVVLENPHGRVGSASESFFVLLEMWDLGIPYPYSILNEQIVLLQFQQSIFPNVILVFSQSHKYYKSFHFFCFIFLVLGLGDHPEEAGDLAQPAAVLLLHPCQLHAVVGDILED